MKKKLVAILLLLAVVISGCQVGKPNDAVAKVGNEYITMKEVDKELEKFKRVYGDQAFDESTDAGKTTVKNAKVQIVNTLINQKVVEAVVKEKKIKVDDKKFEEQYKELVQRVGGEEKYKEALKKENMTDEEFKDRLRKQMELTLLSEKLEGEFRPTDKEIKDYFNKHKEAFTQYNADHILISTQDKKQKPLPMDEIKKKEKEANKVYMEIQKGLDFKKAAQKYSDDPGNKDKGGALGNFTAQDMIPDFSKALQSMKPKEISKPIKTDFGFHIIRLNSMSQELDQFDKDVKQRVTKGIQTAIIQEKMSNLVMTKSDELGVEVFEKELGIAEQQGEKEENN